MGPPLRLSGAFIGLYLYLLIYCYKSGYPRGNKSGIPQNSAGDHVMHELLLGRSPSNGNNIMFYGTYWADYNTNSMV